MPRVTAKVKLSSKTPYNILVDGKEALDQVGLAFQADYDHGRNKEWAKYTPAISVMMTVKPEVAEHFQLNEPFTLVFIPDEPVVSSPDA